MKPMNEAETSDSVAGNAHSDGLIFKSFNDFDDSDLDPEASVSKRMLARLQNVDNPATLGPRSAEGRAALASSVVAHAVVELEAEIIELKRLLDGRCTDTD